MQCHKWSSLSDTYFGSFIAIAGSAVPSTQMSADWFLQSLGEQEDHDNANRRELLARRPSYRKILNDLSSGAGTDMMGEKIQEEDDSNDSEPESNRIVYSSSNSAVG